MQYLLLHFIFVVDVQVETIGDAYMVVSGLPTTSRRPVENTNTTVRSSNPSIYGYKDSALDSRSTKNPVVVTDQDDLQAASEIASFALQYAGI